MAPLPSLSRAVYLAKYQALHAGRCEEPAHPRSFVHRCRETDGCSRRTAMFPSTPGGR
ncbi:hypothetical protein RALTA_B2191 [Cupriavidus taiwanensis LMG 19424]|uniref:Uncharacterized protein n=1 Tax=Cupriavidus taiwanensis (strain DSM 17343 / BCRC 17206 / CCUG 44338 / CIP 107171 / LMG 19424 / R1) TaxID=977880 RepID=B3RCZ3_CUPTR|nr:hypothetical protein RALTA_B2191 [Cupriavidus taiwanensis LMG 19424]SOY64934.1 hypothetical protein CBM2585_B20384 [Cupriavidus taiwanensis]